MALITSSSHAAEHGIELSKRGLPSVRAHNAGQYWIAGIAVVTPAAEQPGLPVRPGAAYKGTAVLATGGGPLLAVISAGADPTKGVVLRADAGDYTVTSEGTQGMLTKRPKVIEVETAEWLLAISAVNKMLTTMMKGKAEAELLAELTRGARR